MENPYSKQDISEKITQLYMCMDMVKSEINKHEFQLRLLNRQKECLEYYLEQEKEAKAKEETNEQN